MQPHDAAFEVVRVSRSRRRRERPLRMKQKGHTHRPDHNVLLRSRPVRLPRRTSRAQQGPRATLTRNDELHLLRHGNAQLVGGKAAVPPLEVRHGPGVGDPEGPRAVGDGDLGVGEGEGLVVLRPREPVRQAQLNGRPARPVKTFGRARAGGTGRGRFVAQHIHGGDQRRSEGSEGPHELPPTELCVPQN